MSTPGLFRVLTLRHALILGVGSMLGAGVFTVFGPAAAEAGTAMLWALGVAALIAFANATSSAQLAAIYPTSGGTYIYGREQLGPWPGFIAGWMFLVGKVGSATAMALTIAAHILPLTDYGWAHKFVAAAVVILLSTINYRGITRTATTTAVIVALVLILLTILTVWSALSTPEAHAPAPSGTLLGIFQASGLFFFAFAGYARIATMGEEVKDPQRTIPRAILFALAIVFILYLALSLALIHVMGYQQLQGSPTALAELGHILGGTGWLVAVSLVATLASAGALLALLGGLGRTSLAMARHGDLPQALTAVHPKYGIPHRAELLVTAVIVTLVLTVDLRNAIGLSAFAVLLYYFIANIAAFTQTKDQRRYPRALQVVGAVGCVAVGFLQPLPAVIAGLVAIGVGMTGRILLRK